LHETAGPPSAQREDPVGEAPGVAFELLVALVKDEPNLLDQEMKSAEEALAG
jgi:hypothetical protein